MKAINIRGHLVSAIEMSGGFWFGSDWFDGSVRQVIVDAYNPQTAQAERLVIPIDVFERNYLRISDAALAYTPGARP